MFIKYRERHSCGPEPCENKTASKHLELHPVSSRDRMDQPSSLWLLLALAALA